VIISQLAPGGLAERTGALHIGDHLVAINGQSLVGEGQKVARAIQLLQQPNGNRVQLKICRATGMPGSRASTVGSVVSGIGGHWPRLEAVDAAGMGRLMSTLSTIQSADSRLSGGTSRGEGEAVEAEVISEGDGSEKLGWVFKFLKSHF
jgi:PDZ domain